MYRTSSTTYNLASSISSRFVTWVRVMIRWAPQQPQGNSASGSGYSVRRCSQNCGNSIRGRRGFLANRQNILNLPEILAEVDRMARRLGEPTAFYLGKLQDGLTLDPLTGYSRQIVPFFADHPLARLTLLTKSADVRNLLDLDHRGHSILSWTVNPKAVVDAFEPNTPALAEAYEKKELRGKALLRVRRLVEERRSRGKSFHRGVRSRANGEVSSEQLLKAYREETARQKAIVQKGNSARPGSCSPCRP